MTDALIGGCPKGSDFGVSLGTRSPAVRDEFRRYFESAIEVPGPACNFVGTQARNAAVHVVVGVIERDGGTLNFTALTIGPAGSLLGKHRKLMSTALERVVWGSGDGSSLPVVATQLGSVGSVIRWEVATSWRDRVAGSSRRTTDRDRPAANRCQSQQQNLRLCATDEGSGLRIGR